MTYTVLYHMLNLYPPSHHICDYGLARCPYVLSCCSRIADLMALIHPLTELSLHLMQVLVLNGCRFKGHPLNLYTAPHLNIIDGG